MIIAVITSLHKNLITAQNFASSSAQANLVSKNDIFMIN